MIMSLLFKCDCRKSNSRDTIQSILITMCIKMATIDVEKTETIKTCSSCRRCLCVRSKLYLRTCIYRRLSDKTTVPIIQLGTGVLSVLLLFGIHPIFRYRNNINICLNINNNYNYVNQKKRASGSPLQFKTF
jgi:hypothetical protein